MTRPLTLHPHEVKRLHAAGTVTLWRPVPKQPPSWCVSASIDPETHRANWYGAEYGSWPLEIDDGVPHLTCPHGAPGEVRWCREKYTYADTDGESYVFVDYAADERRVEFAVGMEIAEPVLSWLEDREVDGDGNNWRSPVTQPRWASRADVTVTGVVLKRVWEVTHEDAIESGIVWSPGQRSDPRLDFVVTWDEHFGKKHPYGLYPWAWVVQLQLAKESE